MKNLGILSGILVLLIFGTIQGKAQCNSSEFSQKCITKVQEGYTFLKSFEINPDKMSRDKIEYSYVFSKDTNYFLNVCSEGDDNGIIVTIYDANRKVASTNYVNNKFFPAIVFSCKSTGIYYISYTFNKNPGECGGSVLAFRR
jgi:hypothetical protein